MGGIPQRPGTVQRVILWDVVIAGSGPAASVAAHVLARADMNVMLLDRVDATRHKVGEVLPGAAGRLLRSLDLETPGSSSAHTKITGSLSGWQTPELILSDAVHSLDGPSWRLDRARFDEELRGAAESSGATLRPGFVRRFERKEDFWEVRVDDGSHLRTRWLIDATGRKAVVGRSLGAKRIRDTALVALYAMSEATARAPRSQQTVVEAAPDGWWYAAYLPTGFVVAGLHVKPSQAARLRNPDEWKAALSRTLHIGRLFPEIHEARLLAPMDAGGARLDRLHGDGWIACGDAAFSFDPLSSQGLLTALYSGKLAAEYLARRLRETSEDVVYGRELEDVWETYKTRLRAFYGASGFQWR
jgi:flavin-dependent dehydrogenase